MTRCLYLVFSLFLFSSLQKVGAQHSSSTPLEIGMDVGGMVSLSPLTPYGRLGAWKQITIPSIDFFIEQPIIGPLSIRGKLFFGSYGEDDNKTQGYSNWDWLREYRRVKFKTSVKEITGMLVYNFFQGNTDAGNPRKLTAYVFAGAGVAFVNVQRDWSQFNTAYFLVENPSLVTDLAKDTLHALPKTAFIMPLGGGLKYAVSPKVSLLGEVDFRYTTQDYLDGFSNVGNNQANEGYNLKKNDFYYGVSVGISYKVETAGSRKSVRGMGCPKVVW